jgi:hypothetical protein
MWAAFAKGHSAMPCPALYWAGLFYTFAPGKFMHLEDVFKEAHEEFRRAIIVLGDSRILAAAGLFVLVVLLHACMGGAPPD